MSDRALIRGYFGRARPDVGSGILSLRAQIELLKSAAPCPIRATGTVPAVAAAVTGVAPLRIYRG